MTRMIFVGASTGGTHALQVLLAALPADAPPLLVVQHMPARFVPGFAARLDATSRLSVRVAEDDEPIRRGHAYLAPGSAHLRVAQGPGGWRCGLDTGPPVNGHRPSVDALFHSAVALGAAAVGVLLTGMGKDGAAGLAAMHRAGAHTIAQDEASAVVFGMPRAAIALGAVDAVLPLADIAPYLARL